MRKILLTAFILCVAAAWQSGISQNLSNKGKEFWIGYGHHQFMEPGQTNSQTMVLYLSAEQPAVVTVSINGTTFTRTYNIPANTVITTEALPKSGTFDCRLYSLPASFGGTNSEGIFTRGIQVKSDVPIVAYAHIYGSASSGATMLMPVETWGYSYISLNFKQSYASNCFSWVNVMAYHDDTKVQITPSVPTRNGKPANVMFEVTLNKGEIYQLLGAISSGSVGYDVTGTTVKSVANTSGDCYPVGVVSGSSRTLMGLNGCNGSGGDNFFQQVFPSQAWGKRYLTAPTSTSNAVSTPMTNYYRVVVKDPSTVVLKNGVAMTGLTGGIYYEYTSSTADYISADKPILVAQYMPSSGCNGSNSNTGANGDPEMFYISPIEQAIKQVGFYRNTSENITLNYLTLIIPDAGLTSLRINGSAAYDHAYAHPNLPGYTVVVKRWTAAQAQARVTSDSAFTAITYGLGSVESYGYNAGTLINNLNVVGEISNQYNPQGSTNPFTCKNTPFYPTLLIAYKPTKLVWRFSQVNNLTPNADLTDNAPTLVDSVLIGSAWYYRYRLTQPYQFSDTGTYQIPILSSSPNIENCRNTEEVSIYITVRQRPSTDFTFSNSPTASSYTGCQLDTLYFHGNGVQSNGVTVNYFKWKFSGNAADTSNVQNPAKLYAAPGTYTVSFSGVAPDGCIGDTTKVITIYPPPTTAITASPTAGCQGSTIAFTGTGAYTGPATIQSLYWNFGNGTTQTTTTTTASATYSNAGLYNIRQVAKVSATCISDTATLPVRIWAKPLVNFTFPQGCLQPDGTAQFNDATQVPDSQNVTYSWDFGDANATPANPNTSTLRNPIHKYSSFGTYSIKLTVATANGCTADTTISVTFSLSPVFAYAPINSICVNGSTVSVANASVTNAVPGVGRYRGPGTDTAGNFNPVIAGVGTHTVWYVYQTTGGCRDSISQTVTVKPAPIASFTYPTACLNTAGTAQFASTSTVTGGSALTYSWNFGDSARSTTTNPNTSTQQSPVHLYSLPGTYSVQLLVNAANGCSKDTVVSIPFGITPALQYPALAGVCANQAPLSIATGTVTNNVTGNGKYRGPGTDTSGNFNPASAGVGTHTIWYIFRPANGSCVDSVSQTITVKPVPLASFTNPVGCLGPNGLAQFTNTSTANSSGAINYNWNFGDSVLATPANPNTSTQQNPTHLYAQYGSYTVRLTVSAANGCSKDTAVTSAFYLRPVLSFPRLAGVCVNSVPVSIAIGSVTNSVPGSGKYRGPGTDTTGRFNPAIAGTGTHTIWYVYQTPGSCNDSVSQTIRVFPKPTAAFALSQTGICADSSLTVTPQSTVSTGSVQTWNWNFGNGTAVYQNANPFNLNYTAGTYTIRHYVVSDSSCVSDTATQTVTIHPLPVANFTLPASICMPAGRAQFSNTSSVAGGGLLTYTWNFGDQSPSVSDVSPLHIYSATGPYDVRLQVATAYGCKKDTTKQLTTFYDQPVAAFATSATLCQGTFSLFTDNSTATGSSISQWQWSFGDNSTSVQQAPRKRYAQAGSYNVSLVVKSLQGCESDTVYQSVVVYKQPRIDAGPSFLVPEGTPIQFAALANDTTLQFQWTPANLLSNDAILNPTTIARSSGFVVPTSGSQTYLLTATGEGNCTATDTLTVKVMRPINVPNAFSPNGDGVNDTWVLPNLGDYPGATLEVYDRYGKMVLRSTGYARPWDGTLNSKPLPIGTYYYVIDLRNGFAPLNGPVTIIR